MLKLNMGAGNNFIVKNSNILIAPNGYKEEGGASHENQPVGGDKSKKPGHQRAFSYEGKAAKMYSNNPNTTSGKNQQTAQ